MGVVEGDVVHNLEGEALFLHGRRMKDAPIVEIRGAKMKKMWTSEAMKSTHMPHCITGYFCVVRDCKGPGGGVILGFIVEADVLHVFQCVSLAHLKQFLPF